MPGPWSTLAPWRPGALACLLILSLSTNVAHADQRQTPAAIWITIRTTDARTPGTGTIVLTSAADPSQTWSADPSTDPAGQLLGRVPAGPYTVDLRMDGFRPGRTTFTVAGGEQVTIDATAVPVTDPSSTESHLNVEDRYQPAHGTAFDAEGLRRLPTGGSLWGLLENAEFSTIADRIDVGGLYPGEPARVGSHGSSWTQASFSIGGLDATDPLTGGVPLLYPELALMQAVNVTTGMQPTDISATGPSIALVPRRPTAAWTGSVQSAFAPGGLRSGPPGEGAPPIATLTSFNYSNLLLSGPLVKDRVGLVLSATRAHAERFERADPTMLTSGVGSVSAHLVFTPNRRDELRVLAMDQRSSRPTDGLARRAVPDERASFVLTQATWERKTPSGSSWTVGAGYRRGTFEPEAPAASTPFVVDRIDGPPSDLLHPAGRRTEWQVKTEVEPSVSWRKSRRHTFRVGASVTGTGATAEPMGFRSAGELVYGLPARVWTYGSGQPSHAGATTFAAYGSDRFVVTPTLLLEAGLRFEHIRGSARQADNTIDWTSLAPRLWVRKRLTELYQLSLFGGFGRYDARLPLSHLTFGDADAPQGSVYRWLDRNGNLAFEESERGPLVSRVGPGSFGTGGTSIDPQLQRPYTDELIIGFEGRPNRATVVRLVAMARREHLLAATVNVGVPLSSYILRQIPDPGWDIANATSSQLLPVFDRLPSSFGQDRYVLTNPSHDVAFWDGFDLTIESELNQRFHLLFSGTASRSGGPSANRGFLVSENDQDLIGELYENPNALTYSKGRLFFERGYTLKLLSTYDAPHDVRIGLLGRYQDGQHFSRLLIVTDLNQGPEAIQASSRGRTRFAYTMTADLHVEKGFQVGGSRLAGMIDVFNLLNRAIEVEEHAATGPAFRTTSAVQPRRVVHIGFRVDF